jgi:hypothetical protein
MSASPAAMAGNAVAARSSGRTVESAPRSRPTGVLAEFLGDQDVGEVVAAGAAVLLGDGQAKEAERPELLHDASVHLLGTVPCGGVGDDLAVDELGREFADGSLLFVELQVHGGPQSTGDVGVVRRDLRT